MLLLFSPILLRTGPTYKLFSGPSVVVIFPNFVVLFWACVSLQIVCKGPKIMHTRGPLLKLCFSTEEMSEKSNLHKNKNYQKTMGCCSRCEGVFMVGCCVACFVLNRGLCGVSELFVFFFSNFTGFMFLLLCIWYSCTCVKKSLFSNTFWPIFSVWVWMI